MGGGDGGEGGEISVDEDVRREERMQRADEKERKRQEKVARKRRPQAGGQADGPAGLKRCPTTKCTSHAVISDRCVCVCPVCVCAWAQCHKKEGGGCISEHSVRCLF